MSYATQARPYALAAYDIAEKKSHIEAWSQCLEALDQALTHTVLFQFLKNPTIAMDVKVQTLETLCHEWMNEDIKRFVRLLADSGRLSAIGDIKTIFVQKVEEAARQVPAAFTTAIELTQSEQESLVASVSQKTGLNLVSTFIVDPEIIGGAIIRFNGNVLDVSVRDQLAQLKQNLIR